MQALSGLAPLVAFFVTYSLRGLYTATAVLMGAMLLLLAFDWWRTRSIPKVHALSTLLVWVLGGATLLLHNRLFIQWKPTVLFWVLAAAFAASHWIGARTLTERFLGSALEGRTPLSAAQWRRLNVSSVLLYVLLGAANLAVAYSASERAWVYFKLFGLATLIFVGVALQVLWAYSRTAEAGTPALERSRD